MDTSFIHLHCHSNYSFLDGTMSVDELIEQAVYRQAPSLALTDINNICGSVEFYEKAKLRGIKPVIGAEITIGGGIVVLLVKNHRGYRNLCRLLTKIHLSSGHNNFICGIGDLLPHKDGLILLSGGRCGIVSRLILERKMEEAVKICRLFRESFGRDFYLELTSVFGDDKLLNYRLSDISGTLKIPLAASNDVFLATRKDQPVREALRAMKQRTTVEQLKDPGSEEQYFRSANEMHELFRRYPDALQNTRIIADSCNFEYSLGRPVFPKLNLPENETSYSVLWKTAFEGMQKRYRPLRKTAMKRLEYELNIIHNKGFSEYFLVAKDIVDYCRSKGIPCAGRGSAGDSLVSYALGITPADPIKHDLYFERFLNPERSEPPDIDLDICWKSRDGVLHYIHEKYGHDKTAMICTFNTFQLRSAIGEAGKACGLPEDEVRKLTKTLPHRSVEYLDNALSNIPECRDHPVTSRVYGKILDISKRIAGFPRHLSVHPGGVIIAPDEITNYTALIESGKKLITSHHDMHSIEKLGLVKMDILGVRGLSVIADCVKYAGLESVDSIPDNDKLTMRMIMSGRTVGCFQLESPAMRGLLRKLRVQRIEDIIAAVAVIRPGPAEGGMKDAFIRRRAGVEKVTYPHPLLEPILKETYGIVVYQEQVLRIAVEIAGFSFGESDLLRRAMTKSRTSKAIKALQQKFIDGAEEKGLTEKHALNIWQFLANFVGYGFNKAHSATYGMLAFKSAYLKNKYPVQFMTAVLNNGGGFYSLAVYIEEARRNGITIEPPDVNRSEYLFTYKDNCIISGFYPVYELSRKGADRIIDARREEPFRNIFDFLQRAGLMEREALNLAKAGALRSLHESEPESLAIIKVFYRNNRKPTVARRLTENLSLPPYTITQRIISELEILNYTASAHPLSLFPEIDMDPSIITSLSLEKYKNQKVTVAGWMVTGRRAPTKDGRYLKFATIEDKHGLMEAVLFPEVYDKYGKILKGHGPFKITGTIQSRVKGESNIIVESVRKIRSKRMTKSDSKLFDKEIEDPMFFDAA